MDIELKLKKSEFINHNYFRVLVMSFNEYPTDNCIYYRQYYQEMIYPNSRYYAIGDYIVIAFYYQTNYNYLGIIINFQQAFQSFSYINFRVDVTKYYYSDIKDLTFNTNYTVDTSMFSPPILPFGYQNFIRIHNESVDEMEIQLTTHDSYKNDSFKVDVCEYKEKSQMNYKFIMVLEQKNAILA